ncbi:hypothetical protein LTR94_032644, partial [Friedmanniomyces endolithicus]
EEGDQADHRSGQRPGNPGPTVHGADGEDAHGQEPAAQQADPRDQGGPAQPATARQQVGDPGQQQAAGGGGDDVQILHAISLGPPPLT